MTTTLPQAVRTLLHERVVARRSAIAATVEARDAAALADAQREMPEIVSALRQSFQQRYLELLLKPTVRNAIERVLRSKDTRAVRDLLTVLLPSLLPAPERGGAGNAARITFISRVERPLPPPVDVTPVEEPEP